MYLKSKIVKEKDKGIQPADICMAATCESGCYTASCKLSCSGDCDAYCMNTCSTGIGPYVAK